MLRQKIGVTVNQETRSFLCAKRQIALGKNASSQWPRFSPIDERLIKQCPLKIRQRLDEVGLGAGGCHFCEMRIV